MHLYPAAAHHARFLVCALAAFVLLWLAPSAAEAQAVTQRVELARGKNLVSLTVQPSDARMEAVLAPVLDDVEAVWGPGLGRYAPGLADDLAEWDWQSSYIVYAKRPVAFDVVGAPIDDGVKLALEEGLNSIPFPRQTPMPVAEAFASVADVLEYVEAGDGRRYPADEGAEPLEALEPGQGYRVYLSAAADLVYPPGGSPFEGDVTVGTIAEALALRGLEAGTTVGVRGYYAPGDGGGGVFEVRDSGAATDGGLVLVPDEFVSGEITEVYDYGYGDYQLERLPEGESVVFGSLRLIASHEDGRDPFPVDGVHLHGHEFAHKLSLRPYMDYETGTFDDVNRRFWQHFAGRYEDRRSGRIQFSYRHTTAPIRLHRTGSVNTLNAHWFGVRPAAQGPMWYGTTDVQPLLAHVLNVAAALNEEAAETVRYVLLPALETYDTFGSLELSEGITLRGAAGTELVTFTNDLGHTYQPVRVREQHTRLRTMDGQALLQIRMLLDPSDPDYLPEDAKAVLHTRATSISPATSVLSFGIEDIVLDGNWENNRQAWEEGWASHSQLETWGRNTPSHAGVAASNHGGKRIPQGQIVTLRNVAVLGFISNGIIGEANNTWDIDNLRIGNSMWNHVIYNANGNYNNITFTGFAWGHTAWGYGNVENMVYEGGAVGPYRPGKEIMGIRGGDVHDATQHVGNTYFTREDGTVPEGIETYISASYIDLRGSGLKSPWNGLGPNVRIGGASADEPCRIITDDGPASSVYQESGNGWQKDLYTNNRIEHIIVYDNGDRGRDNLIGVQNTTASVYRNVRTDSGLLSATGSNGATLSLKAIHRGREAWDEVQTVTYEEIVTTSPHQFVASVYVSSSAVGRDVTIRRSSFANTTNTIFRADNGKGTLESLSGDPSKLRVTMEDVSLRLHGNYFSNLEIFFATTRFLRVTDTASGRTSEDEGAFSYEATGGETVVEIPTNLFWKPQDPSFIEVDADVTGLVQSAEAITSSDNEYDWRGPTLRVALSRALEAGEQVAFDWSASVRPLDP